MRSKSPSFSLICEQPPALRVDRWRRILPLLIVGTAALAGGLPAAHGADRDDHVLLAVDAAAMQRTVEALARDMQLPGAVVIVKTPNGNFSTTYGVTTYRGAAPTACDQKIRVGSVTKSWVGTVILQQIQEGKLALSDPVAKHWPGVPGGDRISIEQLLAMRSHLFNYTELVFLNRTLDEQPRKAWSPQALLDLAFAQPPYVEDFHYSKLPGYNTFMAMDPVHDVTIVVWANAAPAADGRAPATRIAAALIGAIYAQAR